MTESAAKIPVPPLSVVTEMIQLGGDDDDDDDSIEGDHHQVCVHTWTPLGNDNNNDKKDIKACVVIYHGFLAHGLYPTVRYAAELLQKAGYLVVAADMRGHGQTPGLYGYLPDADQVLQDASRVAEYAMSKVASLSSRQPQKNNDTKKLFLLGSSMGGTIALLVAQHFLASTTTKTTTTIPKEALAGVVLLAPMLKLKVSNLEQTLLSGLAMVIPTWCVIPSSSTNIEKQCRDPDKRRECENDAYNNNDLKTKKSKTICVASAWTCVSLINKIKAGQVQVPFWLGVADEDVVVDPQGCLDLYKQSPSTADKTMKRYPALHALLCEPSPLYDEITKDLLDWIEARVT